MQDEAMSDLSKVCSRQGDRAAATVMQATVADLDGYWLELQCTRHGTVMLPVRLILACAAERNRKVA